MPGHIAKTTGPDPCPDQWLYVSDELKVILKSKPYDPKKSCWVPDKTGGYMEGLIEGIDGEKATVKIIESGDVSTTYLETFNTEFCTEIEQQNGFCQYCPTLNKSRIPMYTGGKNVWCDRPPGEVGV